MKVCVAVLHFFIANSAKFDVEGSTLSKELQQLGLPKGELILVNYNPRITSKWSHAIAVVYIHFMLRTSEDRGSIRCSFQILKQRSFFVSWFAEHSESLSRPYLDNKEALQAKFLEQTLQGTLFRPKKRGVLASSQGDVVLVGFFIAVENFDVHEIGCYHKITRRTCSC
jgi:hypothetical protein